jgi:hypothetical protein
MDTPPKDLPGATVTTTVAQDETPTPPNPGFGASGVAAGLATGALAASVTSHVAGLNAATNAAVKHATARAAFGNHAAAFAELQASNAEKAAKMGPAKFYEKLGKDVLKAEKNKAVAQEAYVLGKNWRKPFATFTNASGGAKVAMAVVTVGAALAAAVGVKAIREHRAEKRYTQQIEQERAMAAITLPGGKGLA